MPFAPASRATAQQAEEPTHDMEIRDGKGKCTPTTPKSGNVVVMQSSCDTDTDHTGRTGGLSNNGRRSDVPAGRSCGWGLGYGKQGGAPAWRSGAGNRALRRAESIRDANR